MNHSFSAKIINQNTTYELLHDEFSASSNTTPCFVRYLCGYFKVRLGSCASPKGTVAKSPAVVFVLFPILNFSLSPVRPQVPGASGRTQRIAADVQATYSSEQPLMTGAVVNCMSDHHFRRSNPQIDIYSSEKPGAAAMNLRDENLNSINSLNVFHPSLNMLAGANSSGKVYFWSEHSCV